MIRIFGIARLIQEEENSSKGESYIGSSAHIAAERTYDNHILWDILYFGSALIL
ncbi:MAG: hypothetical protein ACTMUB_00455 [cyanobacterium endosymbiont of Rhopalodia musculus]|uniref:hypothetical protein n=1 Tax=cyanobacterium endosymbiont of Epithemia clementina EcSB TaxID=3034674 RepID=UPI0024800F9C|nr:hypothetical protein [cyanobacterium endosymbiont of Epithemia clementina EcSB]WGT66752.1 hypothetical protein P3F56_05680 [cyanobacterium endosymbiont of Epithemia clementina EcSB]